jgi:hypothetical protein
MGVGHEAARNLTLWEYGMLIDGWDRAHSDDRQAPPPPLTDEEIEAAEGRMRDLEARGVRVLH